MHDLNFFRSHLDEMRQRLSTRGFMLDVDAFQDLDKRRRECLTESEQLKAERNQATAEIGKLRREGIDTSQKQQAVREMGERMAALDQQAAKLDECWRACRTCRRNPYRSARTSMMTSKYAAGARRASFPFSRSPTGI
jgi:seryl-tRNA synthetase